MKALKIGDRVRIIAGHSGGVITGITCPDAVLCIGKEGTITDICRGVAVPCHVCVVKVQGFINSPDLLGNGEIECLPEWLEPIITDDGRQKVSWKECPWRPEHLREEEKVYDD